MRILLTHNNFAITGGADVFYHDVGRLLAAHGDEVAFFSCADSESSSSPWGVYFPEAAPYDRGNLLQRVTRFPGMVYSGEAKRKFGQLLRDFRPDIVHAFAIYTKLTPSILDAAAEQGVPVVMTCNDYKLICPNYSLFHHGHLCESCKGGRFYHAITNRCGHDSLVYSSGMAMEAYAQEWTGIYRKRVDTFLFESEFIARKTEEFWGPGSFRWRLMLKPFNSSACKPGTECSDYCLYVGRLHSSKGVDLLLRALGNHRGIRLLIVGDGPDRSYLEGICRELGLNSVTFLGWQSRDKVAEYLRSARFIVVPSIWYENFPYVVAEAFAYARPVIGSRRGGIPELIRHGEFGYTYEAENIDELGKRMEELWNDPALCAQMGAAAKAWCDERFQDAACFSGLKAVYEDAI